MLKHPGVTCPTCECWISPKKLYHIAETAQKSLNRKHLTRCNECSAEFSYVPRIRKTTQRRWGFRKTVVVEIVIEEFELLQEGRLV